MRSEKSAELVTAGRVDPGLMLTHKYQGSEHMEESLSIMRSKAADLIKPVVCIG